MKIHSCYSIQIQKYNKIFNDTLYMYRKIVSWYIRVLDKEWEAQGFEEMSDFDRSAMVDKLTHKTKQNPNPKYDFKQVFFGKHANQKVPSNYKDAAKTAAIGSYSSYYSSLKNWENEDEKTRGKKPTMQNKRNMFPVLYKSMNNNYIRTDFFAARIKIYKKKTNSWEWIDVELKNQNVRNVNKKVIDYDYKEESPTLIKKGNRWNLAFPFETSVKLENVKIKDQIIASVYLGTQPYAVVSIMNYKGEILARHFIDYPELRHPFYHSIGKIKQAQQHGSKRMPNKWNVVNNYNREIARRTAKEIVDFSEKFGFNVIVFEHLDRSGKKHSTNKQVLALWRGKAIQDLVEHKCHLLGKRVSTVNGYNSKYLAFDGTGKTKNSNNEIVFENGKVYNKYLNASYNLGARYFIREIIKDNSKLKKKTDEEINKIYSAPSQRTLNTLFELNRAI